MFNRITLIGFAFFMISCVSKKEPQLQVRSEEVPVIEGLHQDSLTLQPEEGLFYYQGHPFSGSTYQYHTDSIPAIYSEYVQGKRHGLYQKWFPNGGLSYEVTYSHGMTEGVAKSWWSNGNLRSTTPFVAGVTEGTQIQYYRSGVLFKKRRLKAGREEGLQQAWRENGKIYNNYEAKNGRIFGLKRANLCYEISNEEVRYSSK